MMTNSCRRLWWLPVLLSLAASDRAWAAGPLHTPVDSATLAAVRGGFASSDATTSLSLSIRQSVYLNDALMATSAIQVTQDGTQLSAQATLPALVQVGPGNTAPPGFASVGAASALIQNSLDNQKIRSVTAIDVSAQILGAYRGMNLQSMLNGALTASLRH